MGKRDFECTPWGNPTYNIFGWQRPCYLLQDGYAGTFQELMETTDWESTGTQREPALPGLHGPLRLRADRGRRHVQLAARRSARPSRPW